MKVLLFSLCIFVSASAYAEDEIYIVATGTCVALKYSAVKDSGMVEHSFYCYPLKISSENFQQDYAKKGYLDQIKRKMKDGRIGDVEIHEFNTKKEAQDFYKSVSKKKYSNRLPLPKSAIEKYRLLHMEKSGFSNKKGDAPFVPQVVQKQEAAKKRAYHDIYD